jgi:hypothetical protein
MDQNRSNQSGPDRSSPEDSGSSRDLGTSSDRAMYDGAPGRDQSSDESGDVINRELDRDELEREPEREKSQSER